MTEDIKKYLEIVPEEQVAAIRESNKYIENTEEIEIRNLLSCDFWKFMYTAKHIQKKRQDLLIRHRKNIEVLSKYADEDGYNLRSIINALSCKLNNEKYKFPLENLSENEYNAAKELLFFSLTCGYYFWNIDNICTSHELLNFFIEHGSMPAPPLPFNSSKEQMARCITYKAVFGTTFIGRESFIEEMKNTKINSSVSFKYGEDKNIVQNKMKIIDFEQYGKKLNIDLMINGDPLRKEEIENIIKKRKCIVSDSFNSDSNPARCVGLLMYDDMIDFNGDVNDFIKSFKKSNIYNEINKIKLFKKSNNAFISDKDDLTLKRWIEITQNCVKNISVLPFSGR